ncbi:MAG TPA: hypothetical protein VJB92_00170 [Candidatus Paceibacterota bacterium]
MRILQHGKIWEISHARKRHEWWIGGVRQCPHCHCQFQIEAADLDKIRINTSPLSKGSDPNFSVYIHCPDCLTECTLHVSNRRVSLHDIGEELKRQTCHQKTKTDGTPEKRGVYLKDEAERV